MTRIVKMRQMKAFPPIMLLFAALNFAPLTQAEESIPQDLNLGFYSSQALEIPDAVKAQEKFIYRITVPYFSTLAKKHYEQVKANPKLSAAALADIIACQKANLDSCVIHLGEIQGSAFLDESGSSIWTNCHIVHAWIEYQKQNLILSGIPDSSLLREVFASSVPMQLKDSNGREIFAGERSGKANIQSMMVLSRLAPRELECSVMDDVVKIRLPSPLAAAGIKRSKDRPALLANQKTFIGGHPRPTDTRLALGKLDSDGKSFYWATGPHLAKGADSQKYFLGRKDYSFTLSNSFLQILLSDSAEGMSGGPALNEKGELVGIYKGLIPLDSEKKDLPLASLFYDIGGMRFVEIFAEGL